MRKEEILERNRKSNENLEDEMEEYISGKAGLSAKLAFALIVVILALFKHYKDIPNEDFWSIFFTYCAIESLYKYYYLKNKTTLLCGILFSIAAICLLVTFILLTYK